MLPGARRVPTPPARNRTPPSDRTSALRCRRCARGSRTPLPRSGRTSAERPQHDPHVRRHQERKQHQREDPVGRRDVILHEDGACGEGQAAAGQHRRDDQGGRARPKAERSGEPDRGPGHDQADPHSRVHPADYVRDMAEPPTEIRLLDLRLILWIQGLRAFLYGFGSVLLGTVLAAQGLTATEVGGVFTAMLAGMAVASAVVGVVGDRLGRRRVYAALFGVLATAGSVFAFTHWLPALIIASLTGTISTDPNESGPITSLEQAMIGQAPSSTRVRVFGRYNAIAYLAGAVGALAAGGPQAFRGVFPSLPANQRFLLAFPVMALACMALAARLSPAVERAEPGSRIGGSPPSTVSRRTIRRLA